MRNGVEVIVATDRNFRPLETEYLRHLSSTVTRPITLAPHTLTNLMSMVLPTDHVENGQSHLMSILHPSFVTRTYYTTYNYPAKILKDNTTTVSNLKTTITNVKVEEQSTTSEEDIQPTTTQLLLNSSPTLQTEVVHTAYTYWNTFLDGEQPIVLSSTHTLSNTLVGAFGIDDNIEPSEVFPVTNTYLKTIEFTQTLTDGTDFQIISTKDLVTQVVVTDKLSKKANNIPITTDVTKTYFVTYTYFSTYIDGDQTKVKSDVSVSSDVTIEKFYIKPKKTETKIFEQTSKTEVPAKVSSAVFPFSILATKTYLTTFTYFTTLQQGPNSDKAETKINSRTKTVENTKTETISLQNFNLDYLIGLNSSLNKITGSLIATATLKGGEKIRITAHRKPNLTSSYLKYEIKPTRTTQISDTKTETYQIEKKEEVSSKTKSTYSKSTAVLPKTKNTLLYKSKIKLTKTSLQEVTAEALVASETKTNFISMTPTVTLTSASTSFLNKDSTAKNSATPSSTSVLPPKEVTPIFNEYILKNQPGESSKVPGGDPSKNKPAVKQPDVAMNVSNLLNLNSLGINGMNVLGPVFNAMAELIHNNLNKNVDSLNRRNDTAPPAKEAEIVIKKPTTSSINPLLSFVNKFTPSSAKGTSEPKVKVTTPRTPVYIPVGSFAKDSEFSESQDSEVVANKPENWHDKWADTHAKNFEKGRPHDPPITILEGGIPISPGQVITTNSDVIIGRPGETGPRPPTFAVKNNFPIDMKPPPLPPHAVFSGEDEDGFLGQHSTNQGVDFIINQEHKISPSRPPLSSPKKHPQESHKIHRPHLNDRYKNQHKNPYSGKLSYTDYDSGTVDLNPPPVPPPPVRSHDVHRPVTINHEQKDESESHKTSNHILSVPVHFSQNQNVENYINPAEIHSPVLGVPPLPGLGQLHQENINHILNEPTPSISNNPNGILLIPTMAQVPLDLIATENSNSVDRSTGQQLLVNIQPSQVANIVIPHGSSTALILSDGKQHSLKGEVIDDPSPHPEPETVGFVGAEPVLKIENEDISTDIHNDVIPAEAAAVSHQSGQDNRILFSNRPHLTTELIKIRPKPLNAGSKGQDFYTLHLATGSNSQHLQSEQQQLNHLSSPNAQSSHSAISIRPQHIENHRQTEYHKNAGDLQIPVHHFEVSKPGEKIQDNLHQNHNTHLNFENAGTKINVNQNYRNEGSNIDPNFLHHIQEMHNPQNLPSEVHLIQNQHKHQNYFFNSGGLHAGLNKFVQGSNPVRGGNGIYVDISPPGHLPPRPNVNLLHQSSSSDKHQSIINEHLLNHQSGLVHDVPLNAQVQLGSSKKEKNPLKEILMSSNTNKHDSIYDPKKKPVENKFLESQNHHKRPLPELPENLSPPPLNKEGNYRIHRPPPFKVPQPISPFQRHPVYPLPPVSKPVDFMMPPPKISHRPNQKPQSEHYERPVIPVGAGAPQQNYPNPRPEDILIVPNKMRPGGSILNYVNNINHEIHHQTLSGSSDLDVPFARDPIKTEYGEEIQESISRPLYPGQLPAELQELNSSNSHNHKNFDASKNKQKISQGSRLKDNASKPFRTKPEADSDSQKESLTNVSTQWSTDYYNTQNPSGISSASPGSFFSFIKKPSGFVTTNNADVTINNNSGFANHKDSPNLANQEAQTSDSPKISSSKSGTGIRIHAVGPSVLPSGFIKNENSISDKRPPAFDGEISESETSNTASNKAETNGVIKEFFSTSIKTTSNDNSSVFGMKTKQKLSAGNKNLNENSKENIVGGSKIFSESFPNFDQKKQPDRHEIQNNGYLPKIETSNSNHKFGNHNDWSQNNPSAVQESEGSTTIKFNSNKITNRYPSVATSEIHNSGSNKPHRYSTIDFTSNQNKKTNKRPSAFSAPKKEENKILGNFASEGNGSLVTDNVKLQQKHPGATHSGNSVKTPSGFTLKNETNHSFATGSNHSYGNKTIHFYEPKPTFDLNEERDGTYNKAGSNVDKWFASNFGGNGNAEFNNKVTNKLTPAVTHRNVSSLSNTDFSTDSEVHINLLNPPKIGDGRPKSEDVMGLSPPPLERPRRPPQTNRPKPPFKFEIPTTAKPTLPPIAIENDFPPVRSPDFNRKPIKPQDIFPPRLPDNFIHHLPDFSIRNHPKPRPQERPVTSMPIDTPASSSSEKNIYFTDEEENSGRDTYFSGSEINGHSKPIVESQPNINSLRPPPPPPPPFNNKAKPSSSKSSTIYQQPPKSTIYQQPPKIITSERIKPETSSSKQKLPLATEVQDILPTPSVNSDVKTTFHTKVSASVTPTAVQTQKDWQYADIITGSETVFDPDKFSSYVTPTIHDFTTKKNLVTTLISTGSTTIFGNLYTLGSKDTLQTIKSTLSYNTNDKGPIKDETRTEETTIIPTNTALPVHTTTLTVTTTMTTVVHSIGHKPYTKTIVLTKTLISTVFNKITETKTLVKPTTATVIQTHTIATTKTALVVPTALYPTQTKYPISGTLKPEIFLADPHAKDTMTISVSSSMNKNKQGEEKRKPTGTRIDHSGKDSIMVFMADRHPDINLSADDNNNIDVISEEDNDINESRVLVGGVFDANNEKENKGKNKEVECSPGCKAKRNELCQRIEGIMKCVCRPGFARMFPDRPCRPTYTYNVKIMLEKFGSEQITHEKNFAQLASPNKAELASATKEGLDRMIMQSDLRDIYHGIMLNGFEGKERKTMVDFYVQLSENTDEGKLMEILKKTLQTSNYSLGGTELFAARDSGGLYAEDFNECLSTKFHDCSENARCFNLKGTYTCSCKEGFTDLSENSQFPGRICSDTIGCEYCGYHGACYSKGEGQITCECFQWYSGERCQINLKVLLIALVTIGAILLALLLVCAVMTCLNRRSRSSTASRANGSSGYLRYRGPSSQSLDRRAMIGDSSSESSVDNLPYICSPHLPSSETLSAKKKPVLRHAKGPAPRPVPPPGMDQRDRAVTVMIPRAKYRPMPPLSPHLTMSTFSPDKHLSKTAAQIATEQKLLNYLDGNSREERTHISSIQPTRQSKEQQKSTEYKTPSTNIQGSPKPIEKKKDSKVFEYEYKISNMLFTEETNSADKRSFKSLDDRFRRHSDSTQLNSDASNKNKFRKYSAGALVSAGYEVSAKVGMHHLEEDTTEDDHSAIINTHTMKSSRSQFTTLNRTGDHKTMSEARSYDETTVHPPTRSLKTHYSGSSPSSRVNNDEGHTMIERDLGSTFIMPESQLFKPEADRGSDISNFDSL